MKTKPYFFGRVANSKIQWHDENALRLWIGTLEGKEIEATVASLSFTRTLPQNKYYWGYVIQLISEMTGHSREEIHEICKSKFNRGMVEIKNKKYEIVRSTTELEVSEFQEYIERIKAWASQELEIIFTDDVMI